MTKKKSNKKTVKNSTKTGSKKPVKADKVSFTDIKPVRILNKKNAIEFANYLYTEKNDGKKSFATFVNMCKGSLKEKSKKTPLACILGEAYMWFVNPNFSEKELQKEVDHHAKEIDKHNEKLWEDDNYDFSNEKMIEYNDPEELVSLILAKNSTCNPKNIETLKYELNELPNANDNACDYDDEQYVIRAKNVKDAWMENIVPLLK